MPATTTAQVIVLARMENTGVRETGRLIRRDCNYFPETEACMRPVSLVWSRDMSRLADAKVFARAEGFRVLVLDDTDDVLTVARNLVAGQS